jgi:preprotein translocase subunit SecG
MTILFVILIILVAVILGFFVLIQNPKGGGLSGNFAGVSSQFMGVKQTNDILERGTWIFAVLIGLLSLLSTFFISGSNSGTDGGRLQDIGNAPIQQPVTKPATPLNTVPATTAPATTAPAADSGK